MRRRTAAPLCLRSIFPEAVLDPARVTDDRGQRQLPCQRFIPSGLRSIKAGRPAGPAEDSRTGKVRKKRRAERRVLRLRGQLQNARGIARKVANRGIELRKRYLHAGTLE